MGEGEPTPAGTEYNPKVVQALLVISPFSALLALFMMLVQGADWGPTIVVVLISFFGCLIAAGVYRLRGAAAAQDAQWLAIILSIVAALGRR